MPERPPVAIDWFKQYIIKNDDVEDARALEEQKKQAAELERKTNMFFTNELNTMSYDEYDRMMDDDEVREKLTLTLMNKHDRLKNCNIKELSTHIRRADKDIFAKVIEGKLTLD